MISSTVRLVRDDGDSVVAKQLGDAPAGLFAAEADGLAVLRASATVHVPDAVECGDTFLVLSDLGSPGSSDPDWDELGRQVARLHLIVAAEFGADHDNFLGRLRQRNNRTVDGWAFFAEHRVLRYLDEPAVQSTLAVSDVRRLEALAARLPALVPAQPASLLHGDLWRANVLATDTGPAVIDPAPYFGWAEAELSMMWCSGGAPERFFDAYREIRPLDVGWQQRMPLLHLRELLSMVAHLGNAYGTVDRIRAVLDKF